MYMVSSRHYVPKGFIWEYELLPLYESSFSKIKLWDKLEECFLYYLFLTYFFNVSILISKT